MVKTLHKRLARDAEAALAGDIANRTRRGRPATAGNARTHSRISFATLRAWRAQLQTCAESPRSASTAKALADMANGLARLLGPYADPDYVPTGPLARTGGWRVVTPDGEAHTCATLAQAAALYGCQPKSLAVMLSRNGGACSKKAYHMGAPSVATVERLQVTDFQGESGNVGAPSTGT